MAATSKDDDYDREGHRCRRCIFWLRGNFHDSFGWNGNGHHHLFCFFFVKRTSELSTRHWAGSKLECVELCNFYFCCALIFCQPMKKFEFLGVSRATRQRHSKTSSTGGENDPGYENRIYCTSLQSYIRQICLLLPIIKNRQLPR